MINYLCLQSTSGSEVTESQIMTDPKHILDVLTDLRHMGISVALDDFGTGYSSFDYLKRFKPDKIKIDKSFIDGLPNDKENAGIVKSMIALCHALGIKILAEGVEKAEQLRFLIDAGCDEIQGFYFFKPLSVYDLQKLLLNKTKLVFRSC